MLSLTQFSLSKLRVLRNSKLSIFASVTIFLSLYSVSCSYKLCAVLDLQVLCKPSTSSDRCITLTGLCMAHYVIEGGFFYPLYVLFQEQ